jgi:hypothetical protein
MKDGKCPKCNSSEVYVMYSFQDMRGNVVPLNEPLADEEAKFARVDNYVCTRCRYTESYISEWSDINIIRHSWQRADGRPTEKRKRMSEKYRHMPKPKPKDAGV